jgi:ATP-dependent protease ClpP protease subunit
MNNIIIGENTQEALTAIREAKTTICVELNIDSCANGSAFDLLAIAKALINHPYATTAKVNGVASIIALTGADTIEIDENALVFITPLTITVCGDINDLNKALATLQKATDAVSNALTKWPEARRIFDAREERFLPRDEAMTIGII